MSVIHIISIIVILIVCSFIISAISYTKQQALKKRKLMVKRYIQQADEALSFISLLLRIDKSYELITQLQNLVVNAFIEALKLNSEDPLIQQNLNAQKAKLSEYKSNQRSNEVCCWLATDSELAATQSQLGLINKLLDVYRNKGALNATLHQQLVSHIQKLKNELATNSYLYQADLYAEQNNITSYQLYIKQAIQVIKKSSLEPNLKNTRIKELSERIQQVKSTGKTTGFKNFIKPPELTTSVQSLESEILNNSNDI